MSLEPRLLLSFVIVNYRIAHKVALAVESIRRYCDLPYEIIVVDNSMLDSELRILREVEGDDIEVIDAGFNGGFGAGCNLGVRHAKGVYVFFLNPDARLTSPVTGRLLSHFQSDPSVGSVGLKLVYEDGSEGHSSGRFIGLRRPFQLAKGAVAKVLHRAYGREPDRSPKERLARGVQAVDWCSGAGLLMRRTDFLCVHGFDESYFLYYEECDLQYRLLRQLGLRAVIDGDMCIEHEDGGTGLAALPKRKNIESGCLRFVRSHRPFHVFQVYRMLLCGAVVVEASAAAAVWDVKQAAALAELLVFVASWRGQVTHVQRARSPIN